jgi:hypothetical protein
LVDMPLKDLNYSNRFTMYVHDANYSSNTSCALEFYYTDE